MIITKGTDDAILTLYRVEFIALALEYKPLNLGQGLPDDLVPEYVSKTLAEVTNENIALNQYTRGFVSKVISNIFEMS